MENERSQQQRGPGRQVLILSTTSIEENKPHSSVPTHTGFCFGRRGGKFPRPFSQAVTAMAISSSDRVASSSSYEEWIESLTR